MPTIFNTKTSSITQIKAEIHQLGTVSRSEVLSAVRAIIDDVQQNGDASIIKYTNQFDKTSFSTIKQLKVTPDELEQAAGQCPEELISALRFSAARIEEYHKKQLPLDFNYIDSCGVRLGNLWRSVQSVGLYVPGGKASYPSSVLMNAVPAKVAGVENIIMIVPAPGGILNNAVLAAAKIAGITEIYKVGGAQAVASLVFSNNSLPCVDKIVGPGNAYVAAAKRELSGMVGIDMIAGPSEILVVADSKTSPVWIAADLLSQAEHDEDAQSILITDDESYAKSVITEVENLLKTLPRRDIASVSWNNRGVVIIDSGFKNTIELINHIAPEHLELAVDNAENMLSKIHNAGAVFLGRFTPEAIGDYTAGPSHVLPTSGTARFSSGLSVFDFLKRISLIGCSKQAFTHLAGHTACLADSEGLGAHALSVRIREGISA